MEENKYCDYLVVGGELHGKIYNGLRNMTTIDLPTQEKRLGKFQSAHLKAEITKSPTLEYNVHRHVYEGKIYAIASNESNIRKYDIDALIITQKPNPL